MSEDAPTVPLSVNSIICLTALLIGAIVGRLFGRRLRSFAAALGWGAAYGFVWWILGALILMPIFVGMLRLASLLMEPMGPVAMGSLLGHLIYGIILGAGLVMVKRRISGIVHQQG